MTSAAFWDNIAEKYASDPIDDMDAYTVTLDRMKALLQPHHRVLEMGCGTGSTALELAGGVDRYVGTDISKNMIAIAREKAAETDLDHLSFEVASADAPIGPHQDVVIALNLLHLVPNVDRHIQQIYDALPSGGLFIAKTALLKDGAWFLGPAVFAMRAVGKAPYVVRLSEKQFLGQITAAGFEIEETLLQPGMAPRLFTVARKP